MDYSTKLPAETLLKVFHFARLVNGIPSAKYIDENRPTLDQDSSSYKTYLLGWVNITYVCSRWRKLALDDASLWTDVPVVLGTRWLKEFMWRSKEMPLTLDWYRQYTSAQVSEDFIDTILPHFQRFRNFHYQPAEELPLRRQTLSEGCSSDHPGSKTIP